MAKNRFSPKPLDDVLANLPARFQSYAKQNQDLSAYQTRLAAAINGPLSDKCHITCYKDNILTVDADSAAVAMRLNYMKMALLSDLRKNGMAELIQIKVQTKPKQATQQPGFTAKESNKEASKRVMSQQTGDALREVAEHAPDSLKQKLIKLAKHSQK